MRISIPCFLILCCFASIGLCIRSKVPLAISPYENILTNEELNFQDQYEPVDLQYKFDNPGLALKILESLNPINTSLPDYPNFKGELNINRDPNYCFKVQQAFVENPTPIFETVNFILGKRTEVFFRKKIIPTVGYDTMPFLHDGSSDISSTGEKEQSHDLNIYATDIYTKLNVDDLFKVGTHFGCITQNHNHIHGANQMADKDNVALTLKRYAEKYQSLPSCSLENKFFPQTWLLGIKNDCQEWFSIIDSPEYQLEKAKKNHLFIRKIGAKVHRGNGVVLVDDEEETALRKMFSNGETCGISKSNYLVQRYINNPLLVQGHKFDFRTYMIISSTNPLVVYYHDGYLRVSLFEYDPDSKDKGVYLTNTAQSEKVFTDQNIQKKLGMNETELRNFQTWNYSQLGDYLVSIGRIESVAWVGEYLRPKIEHAMQNLIRATKSYFANATNVWELYGVDFMLDEELNLWFIECNISPMLNSTNEKKGEFLQWLMKDAFEIVTAQLRSRIKRVINFINGLTARGVAMMKDSSNVIPNLADEKKAFDDLLRNRIEDEFKIRSQNSWVKIVDESIQGTARYNHMFPPECID